MARIFTFLFAAVTLLNLGLVNSESQSNVIQLQDQLDPVKLEQMSDTLDEGITRGDREKRFGLVVKKLGLKAGLIQLLFGKIDSLIDAKTRAINALDKHNVYKNQKYFGLTYPPLHTTPSPFNNLVPSRPKGSTDPPPIEFEVNAPVSFVIPDRLFATSFTLVTNASKILGDVIYNTAGRAQELAERVNAKFKNKFVFAKRLLARSGHYKNQPAIYIERKSGNSTS